MVLAVEANGRELPVAFHPLERDAAAIEHGGVRFDADLPQLDSAAKARPAQASLQLRNEDEDQGSGAAAATPLFPRDGAAAAASAAAIQAASPIADSLRGR